MTKSFFIIAQHRTGSTLLRNILNAHSEIAMASDEMNLFEPLRKNTLDKILDKGKVKSSEDLKKLIDQEGIYGTFWHDLRRDRVLFEGIIERLEGKADITCADVLDSALNTIRKMKGTKYSGVKYPVHLGKTLQLMEWFPKGKFIFLTRNPKAIIASKLNDQATKSRKKRSFFHYYVMHYFTLFYFCFEYRLSARIWSRHRNNLFKITYENLVVEKVGVIKTLCDFCEIQYESKMVEVSGKDSSHFDKPFVEPTTLSVNKYKETLSPFDQKLIDLLTQKSQRILS